MADTKNTDLVEQTDFAPDDEFYTVDISDTTMHASGSSKRAKKGTVILHFGLQTTSQGRLTTETGVAVSATDRTAQSTIYFTPYSGNRIALYDGTRWGLYAFTERSLALSGLTSDKNYDVFLYNNSGTLTLELSAAWTNDTTRADALTTQDGIYVKDGATTRRYLGTLRTTGTTTTEDSLAKRFVSNYYNVIMREVFVSISNSSYSYSSATVRQINASAGFKVEAVISNPEYSCEVWVRNTSNSGAAGFNLGIGLDSTSTFSGSPGKRQVSGIYFTHRTSGIFRTTPGYHYFAGLEGGFGASITFNEGSRDLGGTVWN